MCARQTLKARIGNDAQCNAEFGTKFLDFSNHTICKDGSACAPSLALRSVARAKDVLGEKHTLCIEAIHHSLNNVDLVLDRKVDEVRINKNMVRWSKLLVVLEEQC
jgi:hypothetical protein